MSWKKTYTGCLLHFIKTIATFPVRNEHSSSLTKLIRSINSFVPLIIHIYQSFWTGFYIVGSQQLYGVMTVTINQDELHEKSKLDDFIYVLK